MVRRFFLMLLFINSLNYTKTDGIWENLLIFRTFWKFINFLKSCQSAYAIITKDCRWRKWPDTTERVSAYKSIAICSYSQTPIKATSSTDQIGVGLPSSFVVVRKAQHCLCRCWVMRVTKVTRKWSNRLEKACRLF